MSNFAAAPSWAPHGGRIGPGRRGTMALPYAPVERLAPVSGGKGTFLVFPRRTAPDT